MSSLASILILSQTWGSVLDFIGTYLTRYLSCLIVLDLTINGEAVAHIWTVQTSFVLVLVLRRPSNILFGTCCLALWRIYYWLPCLTHILLLHPIPHSTSSTSVPKQTQGISVSSPNVSNPHPSFVSCILNKICVVASNFYRHSFFILPPPTFCSHI